MRLATFLDLPDRDASVWLLRTPVPSGLVHDCAEVANQFDIDDGYSLAPHTSEKNVVYLSS